jgi:c(7)-type cytochrome triheme protein
MAGALLLAFLLGLYATAPPPRRPPANLRFPARPGDVVFPHARHIQWANGDCNACHPKLFPRDAKAPLHWKEGMHKPAEANGTSCGACHRADGAAFETKGNCKRCHGPEPDI